MNRSHALAKGDEAALVAFMSDPQSESAARGFVERFGGFLNLAAGDIVDLEERYLVPDVVQTAIVSLSDGSRIYRSGGDRANPRAFLRFAIRDAAKKVRREQPWTIGPPRREDPDGARSTSASPVTRRWVEPALAATQALSSERESVTDTPGLRPKRLPQPDTDATADPALLRIERDRILGAAVSDRSPLAAPTLAGIAAGVPWTHLGDALDRDPATLRHAVKRVAESLAA